VRAVVYTGPGTVEVHDVAEPELLEPDDALVEVSLTAICGSDLHLLDGKTPGMREGSIIGHEFVGRVVSVGPAVAQVNEGDRVVGSFLIACGTCSQCRARRFNFCRQRRALGSGTLTGDLDGSQAESVRVPHADVNLLTLHDDAAELDDPKVLFCGDILATGVYAAALSDIAPGETVVVIGAGPVGLFCAAAARRRGANVVVVDTDSGRARFARERMGFEAIDGSQAEERVTEWTDGLGVDVVIEAVGAVPALKTATRCVRDGGRITIVGVYGAERYDLPMGRAWVRAFDLRFSGMGNIQAHWEESIASVMSGDIDPEQIVTHRLPLEAAVEGYEMFKSRRALKVILDPKPET
jgi:threonine dehydrogenase-like Zn-dependent dehydrogenase